MIRGGTVYILTNKTHTVLYIGVTSDLWVRLQEHRDKKHPDSFTAKYNCDKVVYYESFSTITEAISREKQLKNWKRVWKEELIDKMNPTWRDLYDEVMRQ